MRRASLSLAALIVAAPVSPQDLPVNTNTAGAQESPAVARDAGGNFVVVWSSFGQDGSDFGVFARRFDAAGNPTGAEFQVNSFTSGRQSRPALAMDPAGNVVVVWSSFGQDGSSDGVFGRRLDPAGTPITPEFPVNTFTTDSQDQPRVAMDAAGNFVVVWRSQGQDGSGAGVFARRFDAGAAPTIPEVQVNSVAADNQDQPAIAADTAGSFVVVWASANQDGSGTGIFGRRFDPGAGPMGDAFPVNTTTAGNQEQPAVGMDAAGNFLVAWTGPDAAGTGVFARRFDASGTPTSAEVAVPTVAADNQGRPTVGADAAGGFVVVFDSANQDGNGTGVFGRRFDPSGAPAGDAFPVNAQTAGNQDRPSVAAGDGFVVVWQGDDGNGTGIFGRRFDAAANPLSSGS